MRRSSFLIAVTSLVLFSATANAATFYVATSGNDASNGTLSAPFRTIKKAATMTSPGDEVLVRGGVYTGTVGVMAKGTSAAHITIRAYPGETPVIDGTGTAAATDLVTFYQASFVDFSGFEVRNATRIGVSIWESNNIRILGNNIHHAVRNGIYAGADTTGISSDITVDGNEVHDNVLENANHTFVGGGWASGINISMTHRGSITNNKVYRNQGEGLGSGLSDYVLIQGNEAFDNFSVNIYCENAQKMQINGNLTYSTGNTTYFRDGYPAAGIGLANEQWSVSMPTSDMTVTNNIVIDGRWGFFFLTFEGGGVLNNVKVSNNTFYKGRQALIEIASVAHVNSFVENNIFYQAGGAPIAKVGGTGVTYSTNLWYGGTPGAASAVTDFYGDPGFANAGGLTANDYKVNGVSPAVHRGLAPLGTTVDYFGNSRSMAYDIGAHEQSVTLGAGDSGSIAPTAPASLAAVAANATTVNLTWTASTGNVAGYKVYRNNGYLATTTETRWTDASAAASTPYTYEVMAFDAAGNPSPASNVVALTTPVAADSVKPVMPATLSADSIADTSVRLNWTAATDNTGVTAYRIYRDGALAGTATKTTFTVTGLSGGKGYSFYVVALDAAGNVSRASNTLSVTTLSGRRRAVR